MKYAFVLLALVGCSTAPVTSDIPNLKPVTGHVAVYRGGQANDKGWLLLQSCGVSNVVKLNLESEGSDAGARALGMTVNYFPIDIAHQALLKPKMQTLSNAVYAIKPGTYVHCEHGQDRTGLVIGCLRVWRDGWTKAAAHTEMMTNGFHPVLHGLADTWEDNIN